MSETQLTEVALGDHNVPYVKLSILVVHWIFQYRPFKNGKAVAPTPNFP